MRKRILLNDQWMFYKSVRPKQEKEGLLESEGEIVSLPHTWNSLDGQDGGNDYFRGTCLYEREISLQDMKEYLCKGYHVWLEVPAAGMCAQVYLSGKLLTEHRGGYSLFRADMTNILASLVEKHNQEEQKAVLQIYVSNEERVDVYPQKADFTFYGGLYRGAALLIVPSGHFVLDESGSLGVSALYRGKKEDDRTGLLEVEAIVSGPVQYVDFTVSGKEVNLTKRVSVCRGEAKAILEIPDVRLWNGKKDPYLYDIQAETDTGDYVSIRTGCRTFAVDPGNGFLLNGERYPLRGVSRHQDRKGRGNALTFEDHMEDMEFISEIGATTVRLAHYQHAQEFYDLCDERGIIVWAEIPYITMHMTKGRENTISQMCELVMQCRHHPSIVCWGLSNEITAASVVNEELLDNHKALDALCHKLDPERLTAMANVFMLETDSPILSVPDVNSYNLYFGWYLGELEENDRFLDDFHRAYPNRVIGLSEYGADANIAFQSSHPVRGDYTETYQCVYHEHMLAMIEERPWLWATHIWNMFDFAADGRDEGGKHGENQKGLVTFDRGVKKDAFYLYKAAWNTQDPFVHLCGRRYRNRNEHKTQIKVYSNEPEVVLRVDGRQVASQKGRWIFTFSVSLIGTHTIEAVTKNARDEMELQYVSEEDVSYRYAQTSGISNWFDMDEIDPDYFSIMDKLGDLRRHPQAGKIVEEMMEKTASSRGDVADAVKDNPALQKMLGRMTLSSLLTQAGTKRELILRINRVLQTIRK